MYFKDCKDISYRFAGELYVNKNRIDYDVNPESVEYLSDIGKVFYLADLNVDKKSGTLKVYDGKEAVKIADDVYYDFFVTPDGRVACLQDYSLKYYQGELYEWADGEKRKIDDDVSCIIKITPVDRDYILLH